MTPEGKVKAKISKLLRQRNIWYFMPPANGYGRSGIPDYVCCIKGRFVSIEVKAPGKLKNLTPNQIRENIAIIKHGGTAIVVDNPDVCDILLNTLEGMFDDTYKQRQDFDPVTWRVLFDSSDSGQDPLR